MTASPAYETLFVARQPVLDATLGTWGYFLFYRRCLEQSYSDFEDPLQATLSVIQCLPACRDACTLAHKTLVHLPEQAVITGIPKALAPTCIVPVVEASEKPSEALLSGLTALHGEGYAIALDLRDHAQAPTALLERSQMGIVDLMGSSPAALAKAVAPMRERGLTILAKRVESPGAFQLARELGCTLFAGHFFRQPETMAQRKVSAAETTRLGLLELLAQPEPEMDQLVAAIEADASVSYRVLALLNSAHFGLLKKVSSVRQAVLLAGWVHLCAWLRVIVLADLSPSRKARELLHLSAQRAKFFETLALASNRQPMADSLFLLGLFSLLPAMLDMPMQTILGNLELEESLRDGLCGVVGKYSPWLAMAQAIEDTRWDDMAECAHGLGLPTGSVAEAYNASFQWADKLVSSMHH